MALGAYGNGGTGPVTDSEAHRFDLAPFDVSLDEFGHRYEDLPMEILLQIFSCLTPSDRREAELTCRRWFEAAQHTPFLENHWLVLQNISFDTNKPPVRMLLDSFRHFPNVQLTKVEFEQVGNFFDRFGPHIRRIILHECVLPEHKLVSILNHLTNLRSFTIRLCGDGYGAPFKQHYEHAVLPKTLLSVTELSFADSYLLSDAIVHKFVKVMPSLRTIDLSRCYGSFKTSIYGGDQQQECESVLFGNCILRLVAERNASLRKLNLSYTPIDGNALEKMAEMRQDLQLKRLELAGCWKVTEQGLNPLLLAQATHLQHLNLSNSDQINDSCLVLICNELTGLRVLQINECSYITNHGARHLMQLSRLEVLDISNCRLVDSGGILGGIASKRNDVLRELNVGWLDLCEPSIIAIAENLRELRVLDLGNYRWEISALCLRHICRNLVHLTHLNLNGCYVPQIGLTGLGMLGEMQQYTQANAGSTEGLLEREENLRTAESLPSASSGFSITRLQRLRKLNLSHTNVVCDELLMNNFRSLELRELSLVGCPKLSHEGIQALALGCPSIEQLDLTGCNSIKDESVQLIVSHLHRLRMLSLFDCSGLTYTNINCISSHYPRLRIFGYEQNPCSR